MENGEIHNDQITASSRFGNHQFQAANARLNNKKRIGNTGAWSSRQNNLNQCLQIDFKRSTIITGISTQGRPLDSWVQYVTTQFLQARTKITFMIQS